MVFYRLADSFPEPLRQHCLARLVERFGAEWEAPLQRRLARLLSWQSGEGWFDEYDVRKVCYWDLFAGAFGHTGVAAAISQILFSRVPPNAE